MHERARIARFGDREPLGVDAARGSGVEHDAASDGRLGAQHEAIAAGGDDGRGEPELRARVVGAYDPRRDLRRAVVHADRRRDVGDRLEPHVEPVARHERIRRDERVAARELVSLDPGEVHGDTLAGFRALDVPVVHLHASHAHLESRRLDPQPVAGADRPRPERARHDRADAVEREDAVDVEPRRADLVALSH